MSGQWPRTVTDDRAVPGGAKARGIASTNVIGEGVGIAYPAGSCVSGAPERITDALEHDALQVLLETAARNVHHSHKCHSCGRPTCACFQVPCPFRPFDRDARGEWYVCGECKSTSRFTSTL